MLRQVNTETGDDHETPRDVFDDDTDTANVGDVMKEVSEDKTKVSLRCSAFCICTATIHTV